MIERMIGGRLKARIGARAAGNTLELFVSDVFHRTRKRARHRVTSPDGLASLSRKDGSAQSGCTVANRAGPALLLVWKGYVEQWRSFYADLVTRRRCGIDDFLADLVHVFPPRVIA